MGNRAVITTEQKKLGIYLHWNGGRDSVEAFLKYCELKKFRKPENDNYGWACLVTVISNFFGSGTSIGIDTYDRMDTDNGDNGVYIIKDWKIIGRSYFTGTEQNDHSLIEGLRAIDNAQPAHIRISEKIDELEKSMAVQS